MLILRLTSSVIPTGKIISVTEFCITINLNLIDLGVLEMYRYIPDPIVFNKQKIKRVKHESLQTYVGS